MMNVRSANRVPSPILARAVLVISFLGVTAAVSGCELVYQPACTTQCQAAGGNDSYARSAQ